MIVEPKPEFLTLTEAEIVQAIAAPGDPIYHDVARLSLGYCENLGALAEELGFFPAGLPHGTPETAIETVALRQTLQGFEQAIAEYPKAQERQHSTAQQP